MAAQYIPLPPVVLYGPIVILFCVYVIFISLWKDSFVPVLALNLIVIAIGFFLHTVQLKKIELERLLPHKEHEAISFQGRIDIEPFEKGTYHQLVVKTSSVTLDDWKRNITRRILLYAKTAADPELYNNLHVGSVIAVRGILEPFPASHNPGEFDYGRYLELQEVEGVARVTEKDGIRVLDSLESFNLTSFFASLRRTYSDVLERYSAPQQANFLKGVLLGDRGDIAPELKQSFIDTGTIHILAVSGFNVGIIALICFSVFSLFRLPKVVIAVATAGVIVAHMFLTGATASVVRATIMASALLIGALVERKTDIYNSLSVAALIILLWDPKQMFDVGFQLSFAAVFSIVYFYPLLVQLIKKIPEQYAKIKWIDYALKLLAVSLAAQLGTIPFTAYYFGRVSVVSLVANLIVVPLVGFNTILGFITIVVSFVSPWVAGRYAVFNNMLVTLLLLCVRIASKVPLAYVETANLTASFPFFYYIGVVGVFNINKPRFVKSALILLLVVFNVVTFSKIFAYREPALVLTALDVGQGDALLLELPNGKHILIDAGAKRNTYDAGERVVVPFLKRKGIHSLDAVFITHAHSDHLGGVGSLLRHIRVNRIIEAGVGNGGELYNRTKDAAQELNIPIQKINAGAALDFDPNVRMYVLHPRLPADSTTHLNNASIVLKVVYGNTSFLLAGDAELEAEGKMIERYAPLLSSDVLKVGHHGSITSSSRKFVEKVKPAFAIISVGRYNRFRHLSRLVIESLKAHTVKVQRTDHAGAIIMRSDGATVERVQWRRTYFD
ncbi:MAG: DNA internalization-related competence protein ComEC/Rec2 [Ignavibacteriales bacterium]|nr:DNA internalization-related competence protein ComEC/Rec2 [Ignavibacteriales bacterium]